VQCQEDGCKTNYTISNKAWMMKLEEEMAEKARNK